MTGKSVLKRFLIFIFFANCTNLFASSPPASHLYPIVWKWLKGKSDSAYSFDMHSHPGLVSNLQDAYQVRRAREFWYNKNLDSFNMGRRNWLGVTDFLGRFQTIRGVFRSGFDMVEQTLGGFTVHIQPVDKDTLEFTIHDVKSRWSLFLHLPFVKNIPYQSGSANQRNMTDTHWVIKWREPVKNIYFHQRMRNTTLYKKKFSGHNF